MKRIFRALVFLSLFLILLFSKCIEGPRGPAGKDKESKGSLVGYITLFDEDDSSGIKISIPEANMSAQTDENGYFEINEISEGVYNLEASFFPYQPKQRRNITITSGTYYLEPFSLKLGKFLNDQIAQLRTLSPDMSMVFFVDCYNQNINCLLYSQKVDGSSEPVLIDNDVHRDYIQVTPDSSRLVYLKNWFLFTSPSDKSSPALIDSNVSTF